MNATKARLDWFKDVVLPHEAALRARLKRTLPRRLEIDDVVSEALTRAYAVEDFERITAGRAYLFQIARNLMIDEARRNQVVSLEFVADLEMLGVTPSAEAALEARDELRRLQIIIDTLPIQCRRAFILRRVYGKGVGEIAEEMGLSVSTVDNHLGRAAVKVMQALGEFEEFGFGRSRQKRRATPSDRRAGGTAVS